EDVKNDFKYVYVSSVFCDKIVGKKREEIIGFSDYDLFDKTIADLFRSNSINILTNHNNGEIVNLGEVPMIIQGEEYTLSLKARYLKLTNGEEYIMTQASDVTDIKRMNNELKKAKNKAEEADKLKSAFLANMSHEIRTPLNAIVGFSELLKHAETPEEKDEYMGIIDTNNDLLLRLIGDILDLSKLDSGTLKLYPEEFDFSLFFTETYSTLKPRCEHSEIELKIHNPLSNCRVTLDKNRVLQILTNYINNAVKFTKKGYIEMGYDYINKGIQFYVKDSGIGVSEEKKEFLFQRFEKLDNFAQGTGLGLSICKAIAEQMEGRVWAESTEGKGSTFFAWIPCEAAVQEEAPQKEENPSSLEKDENKETSNIRKSLLVAEDNNSNYLLLQVVLKEYDLTRAVDGVEAVKYAKQYKYDAILMDMRMPNMDGLEATRKIREFDKETLIIAVTANAFDSDRLNAISAGCNSFITKPIKKQALIEAIS
ncbi:MAG: hybrid sensor histidine kinase/response regulator, partial [Phocaeicola sp.]